MLVWVWDLSLWRLLLLLSVRVVFRICAVVLCRLLSMIHQLQLLLI